MYRGTIEQWDWMIGRKLRRKSWMLNGISCSIVRLRPGSFGCCQSVGHVRRFIWRNRTMIRGSNARQAWHELGWVGSIDTSQSYGKTWEGW